MDARTTYPGEAVFRPETFFLGRTVGGGVVRDPFERIVRRCRIETAGEFNATRQAIEFDEVFTYDDGEIDVWRWVMTAGLNGRYVAAEAKAGAGITGQQQGDDYVLSFRRPMGPAKGLMAPRFSTRFTLLEPDVALKVAKVSLLGLPLGVMTATHQRAD
ncbi:MAG TPA: DUF3833 family protein [Caulobacteraceae bacterium]|nr:DUF3833 family protein [Caulobacteraceae bacterium]